MLLLNSSPLCLCRLHRWTRSWTSSRTCCIIWFPVSRGIRATTDHLREATATTSARSCSSLTTPCPPTSSWQCREGTKMTFPDVLQVWVGFLLPSPPNGTECWESGRNEVHQPTKKSCNCCIYTTCLKHALPKSPTVAKGLPGCLPPGKTSGSSTLILFLNKWSRLIFSQKDQNEVKSGKMTRI